MPADWNRKICDLYQLDEEQREAFTEAIADTEDRIEMNLCDVAMGRRELAVSFARRFSEIDDFQAEEIKKFCREESAKNELLQGFSNLQKRDSEYRLHSKEGGTISLISCADTRSKDNDLNRTNGVHIFADDYRFEGVYTHPERTLEKYRQIFLGG